jgi:hypothetical protein
MSFTDPGIPEEIVGLSFHFLPPERLADLEEPLRALEEDAHLEFLLAVLHVTVNDRPLTPTAPPSAGLLRKLLQALDEADGGVLLYTSPYNDLAARNAPQEPRVELWSFDIAHGLCEFPDLHSVRAFLEHGSGTALGRPTAEAQRLHDRLLRGLVGDSRSYRIWSCSDVSAAGGSAPSAACEGKIWPAEDISPWFHGVFWDDLLLVVNPPESTLGVLALTSR